MFNKMLCNTGRTLAVGRQEDGSSCGICVVNAIEHHMFKTPIFTHSKCNSLRAEYFTKVIEFLVTGVRTMSPDKRNDTHAKLLAHPTRYRS